MHIDENTKYVFACDNPPNDEEAIKYVVIRDEAPRMPPGWEAVPIDPEEWQKISTYFARWGAIGGSKGGKSRSGPSV